MRTETLPVVIKTAVACQIVHATPGRLRIRIPRLRDDADYASRLEWLMGTLNGVIAVRVNPKARSLVVHYAIADGSQAEILERLFTAVQQAAVAFRVPLAAIPEPELSANVRGMGWVLLATLSFAGMQAAIRAVSGGGIHPFQVAFLSHALGLGLLSPWILNPAVLQTQRLDLHGLRALVDTGATLLLFAGLSLTPLAQANALGFTTPLFAMLGATLLLGEEIQPHSGVALGLGILGTLIILRPGIEIIGLGSMLILGGSLTLAGVLLLMKTLSQTESSLTINAYTLLLLTPLTLGPALLVWQVPTVLELLGLVGVAGLMVVGQLAITQAFAEADVTAVLPVDFAQLIWASTFGFVLFNEVPEVWTLVGGLLIFAGSAYAAYAEQETNQPSTSGWDSFESSMLTNG